MTKKANININELETLKKEVKNNNKEIKELKNLVSELCNIIKNNNIIKNTNDNKDIKKTPKTKTNKTKKAPRNGIFKEHYDIIINSIKSDINDEDIKFKLLLINTILFYTGLRISEVLIFTKQDIIDFFDKCEILAFIPKQNKNKKMKIPQETIKSILDNVFNLNYEDFINKIDDNGLKFANRTIYHYMKPIFYKLSLKYGDKKDNDDKIRCSQWSFHSYRTGFINDLINNNFNLNQVQKFIGHENPQTTLKYIRNKDLTDNEIYEMYKKTDRL